MSNHPSEPQPAKWIRTFGVTVVAAGLALAVCGTNLHLPGHPQVLHQLVMVGGLTSFVGIVVFLLAGFFTAPADSPVSIHQEAPRPVQPSAHAQPEPRPPPSNYTYAPTYAPRPVQPTVRVVPNVVVPPPDPEPVRRDLSIRPVLERAWSRAILDAIEWRRFEAVVEAHYKQMGYRTESKSHGSDGGVDIWLYVGAHGTAPVAIVQCKHWKRKLVNLENVRAFRGVLADFNVAKGIYVCSGKFDDYAVEYARSKGIETITGTELLGQIQAKSRAKKEALLDVALEGQFWIPTCARCGAKMSFEASNDAQPSVWACSNRPRCNNKLSISGQWDSSDGRT